MPSFRRAFGAALLVTLTLLCRVAGAQEADPSALGERLEQGVESQSPAGNEELAASVEDLQRQIEALGDQIQISDDVIGVYGLRISIMANLIAAFVGILTVLIAAGGFATWFVRERAVTAAVAKAEAAIQGLVDDRVNFIHNYTTALTLTRQAYTYFDHYKSSFRAVVRGDWPSDERDVRDWAVAAAFARHLAKDGLDKLAKIAGLESPYPEYDARKLRAHLLNDWTYFRMIELLCIRHVTGSIGQKDRHGLLERASECIVVAKSPDLDTDFPWWQLYDSAAKAMILVGGGDHADLGRTLAREAPDQPTKFHKKITPEGRQMLNNAAKLAPGSGAAPETIPSAARDDG